MSQTPDLFDRLFSQKYLRGLQPFYLRHKEVLLYLLFGGLTTVISIGVFGVMNLSFGVDALIANIISWIAAVLFAFVTNRIWVFQARTHSTGAFLRQLCSFYGGRALTLLVEEGVIFLFITTLHFPSMPVKIGAQVLIVVLNYIISKWIVFRKKHT